MTSAGGPVLAVPVRHDVAVPAPDFDLHRLGWRAFQDLVAVVLHRTLGQTFQVFADSNDGGRDGAFYGVWDTSAPPDGHLDPEVAGLVDRVPTVVQCKFSGAASGTLPPSALSDEIAKAARLHRRGLCDAYILVTNLRITGITDAWLRQTLAAHGIARTLTLDGPWLSRIISLSPTLRRYVPRVYGLGDLSQILDERRVAQARALLSRLGDELMTFVPTGAYRAAADALARHGFVLLLGEPAAGKSTIAATLSVAALDEWQSQVMRVNGPVQLTDAWNPNEPRQLFWVDDAFGAIRHDPALTDLWSRHMDQVMTAVAGGARVILTSRDYIYREARPHLKEYAFPWLREQQVVVEVAALTQDEKRRVLYNHLKAGDQPAAVLHRWMPHLHDVAAVTPFRPEVARRLSKRAFTGDRLNTKERLIDFMRRPTEFLRDVIEQLDAGSRAALGCAYVSTGGVPSPVVLTPALQEVIIRLGATAEQTLPAFGRLEGLFLRLDTTLSAPAWQFQHPTLREGFAASVTGQSETVGILIDGLADDELLRQVDCGGTAQGTMVTVPLALYAKVAARARVTTSGYSWSDPLGTFLRYRTGEEFLRVWAQEQAQDVPKLLQFGMYVSAHWQPTILARLHAAGALSEDTRRQAVEKLAEYARLFDPGWLEPTVRPLFTSGELAEELAYFRERMLPDIEDHIEQSADGYDRNVSPEQRYETARDAIRLYGEALGDDEHVLQALEAASRTVDAAVQHAEEEFRGESQGPLAADDRPYRAMPSAGRDEFDDVDHGH